MSHPPPHHQEEKKTERVKENLRLHVHYPPHLPAKKVPSIAH